MSDAPITYPTRSAGQQSAARALCCAAWWCVAGLVLISAAHAKVIAPQITQEQAKTPRTSWMPEGSFKTLMPGITTTTRDARAATAPVLTDEEPVIVRDAAGVWMPQASQSPTKSRADTVVLREQILRAAAIHSLDPYLVKAVAWAESRFNPLAVSPAKAVGMMQVMPATASNLGLRTVDSTPLNQLLKDPWVSLLVGTRYLSQQLTRFNGRMDLALAAYNAGPAAVERAGMRIPNYPETQNYVRSVLTYYVAEKKARTLERLSG